MNSLERVQTVLAGGIPDRVPVCLHNFMLAAREAGVRMEDYRVDPEAIARVHLQAVEKYGHDCILVDTDTTMLAEAMGARSECAPDEPGRIVEPAIRTLDEVDKLKVVNPETDGRIPAILEAVRIMSKQVGSEVAIRGNADQGGFDLPCMVRGIETFMMDLLDAPDDPRLARLMEVCYQSHLAVHRALIKAGAHFTSMGDSLASPDVVSPQMFERVARPYEERLIADLAADNIFVVIHICGDTSRILDTMAEYDNCGLRSTIRLTPQKPNKPPASAMCCLETSIPAEFSRMERWTMFAKPPASSSPSGSRKGDSSLTLVARSRQRRRQKISAP